MLSFFQIMDNCEGLAPVVKLIKNGVFPIIQVGIPILLILFGTLDLGKAVVSNDDKEIKAATGKLIKRAIMAIAVFFVVLLVRIVFDWIGAGTGAGEKSTTKQTGAGLWWTCWKNPDGK